MQWLPQERTSTHILDNRRELIEKPLLSSAEVASSASSSSAAKSSAENPSDSCAGTFAADKDVMGLLPRVPLLKLSVTGLSDIGNTEGAGGLFEASSISHFVSLWGKGV